MLHKTSIISMLLNRRYLPIFITHSLSSININFIRGALVALITSSAFSTSQNSEFWTMVITTSMSIPFFLFSVMAGQMADKYSKSSFTQYIKFFEILTSIFMSIAIFSLANPWLLVLASLVASTQQAFLSPVKLSILPENFKREELMPANALLETSTILTIILGFAMGFFVSPNSSISIFGLLHLKNAFFWYFAFVTLFLSITGYIASLFIKPLESANPNATVSYQIISSIQKNIDTTTQSDHIWKIILGISWIWFIGSIIQPTILYYVTSELNLTQPIYIFLSAMFTVGIAGGSIFCSAVLKRASDSRYSPAALFLISAFCIQLYFSSYSFPANYSIWQFILSSHGFIIILDLIGISFCSGLVVVPLYAMIQRVTRRSNRSQVIACNNIISSIFITIASLISIGWFISFKLNISQLYLFVGVINIFISVYMMRILPFNFVKAFGANVIKFIYRNKVKGIENFLDNHRNVLVVCNHASNLDAIILGAILPGRFSFAVHPTVAEWRSVKILARMAKIYPVDTENPIRMKTLVKLLKSGERCIVFPEGRLSSTGRLMKVYPGSAMVANKAHSHILPIYLDAYETKYFTESHQALKPKLFPKININILPAIAHKQFSDSGKEQRAQYEKLLVSVMKDAQVKSLPTMNLFRGLHYAAKRFGDNKVILRGHDWTTFTYKKLIISSILFGQLLRQRLNRQDEHIGILLPNVPGNVISIFALISINRVPAMLNFTSGKDQMLSTCQTAKVNYVITSEAFVEKANLSEHINFLQANGVNVLMLEQLKKKVNFVRKLSALLRYKRFERYYGKDQLNHQDKPAFVLFTSGSEGQPKGVVLSHRNIYANGNQQVTIFDLVPTDSVFNPLPIFHAFGLGAATLTPILNGASVFLFPNPTQYQTISNYVYESQCTFLYGTNTFLTGYGKMNTNPLNFTRLRCVIAGGEKLKTATRHLWQNNFGIRVFEGYGVTECSPVIATNSHEHFKMNTVGKILPGFEYHLEPVDGIDYGKELWVKGDAVMMGYLFNDQPGVIQPPHQGFHKTGDIVSFDDDGFMSIVDRIKRFAKIGGEMVSLTAVENIIQGMFPGEQHAIINIPHEKKGEQIILITTMSSLDKASINKALKEQQHSSLMCPSDVIHIADMPMLGSGKINYPHLKNWHEKLNHQNNG
ncbi:MAG: MFS transporter [Candidatus Comchoanobacterales bacterium]